MASLQEAGVVRFYRMTPAGDKSILYTASVTVTAPQGGAPDGAGASVLSPDEWITAAAANLPKQILKTNDTLIMTFEAAGADGIDVSDSIQNIPVAVGGQTGVRYLSQSDFANPTAADFTATAGLEQTVMGYRVTENTLVFGGKIYVDVQDDTA